MEQTVYLSGKKVYLDINLSELETEGLNAFKVSEILSNALIFPSKIVDRDGHESLTPELGADCFSLSVDALAAMRLEDGRLGAVFSVSRPGLVGMFFYRTGNTFLEEMVEPEYAGVEVVSGEEEDVF